jgi:cysteinyl-tRNA synthetase
MPVFEKFLSQLDKLFGLQLSTRQDITDDQKTIIATRDKAHNNKDWAKSDELRNELKEQGIGVRDTEHGPIWFRLQ